MQDNIRHNFSFTADNIRIHLNSNVINAEDFITFYNYYKYVKENNILTEGELIRFKKSLIEANVKDTELKVNITMDLKFSLENLEDLSR